jgi:hypothetical protein
MDKNLLRRAMMKAQGRDRVCSFALATFVRMWGCRLAVANEMTLLCCTQGGVDFVFPFSICFLSTNLEKVRPRLQTGCLSWVKQ